MRVGVKCIFVFKYADFVYLTFDPKCRLLVHRHCVDELL